MLLFLIYEPHDETPFFKIRIYELHLNAPRLLLRASWRVFLLAASDIIPPRVLYCAPPPPPSPRGICGLLPPRGRGLTVSDGTRLILMKPRIGSASRQFRCATSVGWWASLSIIAEGGPSWVKVRKNVAEPQHWDGLNGGDAVTGR